MVTLLTAAKYYFVIHVDFDAGALLVKECFYDFLSNLSDTITVIIIATLHAHAVLNIPSHEA